MMAIFKKKHQVSIETITEKYQFPFFLQELLYGVKAEHTKLTEIIETIVSIRVLYYFSLLAHMQSDTSVPQYTKTVLSLYAQLLKPKILTKVLCDVIQENDKQQSQYFVIEEQKGAIKFYLLSQDEYAKQFVGKGKDIFHLYEQISHVLCDDHDVICDYVKTEFGELLTELSK